MLTRRYGYLLLAIFLVISGPVRAFDFETVVEKARVLSQQPYQAPASIPKFLQDVSFTQYQGIRFKPEKSLWRDQHGRFQVMLVLAGASYFRGVGASNAFGLSARGIAVDTGLPTGEQFPSFVEYWLERPDATAKTMTVYALLDGEGVSGAYRFVITPGAATKVAVQATLFPRKELQLLG